MAPNAKVAQAYRAMRELGIIEKTVKPVLKKLLKLYEKNWELIEAENYRALVDAIFEEEDAKVSDKKKCNNAVEEEFDEDDSGQLQRPLKRIRLRGQEGQGSSYPSDCGTRSDGDLVKKPKEEPEEVLPSPPLLQQASPGNHAATTNINKQPVSPRPLLLERSEPVQPSPTRRSESNLLSSQRHLGYKGKEPMSSHVTSHEKERVPVRASNAFCIRDPASEPGILHKKIVPDALIVPKEEPLTDEIPQYEVPIAVIHPDSLGQEDSAVGNIVSNGKSDRQESPASPQVDENTCDVLPPLSSERKTISELATFADEFSPCLEIASSPMGEVKISLSCNSALGGPNFHVPTLDELRESMEKKCLRSYKIIDPNFSVMKLMQDMCECFLELATNSSNESQERLLNAMPALDLMKKSTEMNGLGMGCNKDSSMPSRTSSGSVNVYCSENGDVNNGDGKGLVVIPQNQLSADELRWIYNVNDISKGEERVGISWVNEINKDYPLNFHYISQNLVFQNARVNISLSRVGEGSYCPTCFDNCLSSPTSCSCASQADGVFAYTLEGTIKKEFLEQCIAITRDPQQQYLLSCRDCPLERSKKDSILEPCKGHLKRKIIKECWSKCGCHKQCGNRVVQRGINYKLQVFLTSDGKGWGLRTLDKLPKGAFVCEFVGEVLTVSEFYSRKTVKHTCPVLLDAYWGLKGALEDEEALCLDATFYGNAARFINHRCLDANLIEIPVEVETPEHHYYHLAFFTTREIDAMEELTWDYGIDFDDDDHPVKAFRCKCGSKFCRNMKRSTRSKSTMISG
ncbi:hypothetical protein SLEP1_g14284 [Rubroshorea leprosula]|uniref:Inactive histone-lysine N-methyltransferase SUVR2 n=1 Tax=Rubroshorea leprosula TaxID=152421 RepID=A0AAV5IU05_9ROSI|nr:hypothetical protein SLEP1_g14284 [Rubroshorea leprosula]